MLGRSSMEPNLQDHGEPVSVLNFWEPGGYQRTTKRVFDGYELCNDLAEMIEERAEIETKHANEINSWSTKWNGKIVDKDRVYGSLVGAWKAVFVAADREAEVRLRVKKDLINIVQEIGRWQQDHFHQIRMLNSVHFKEKKDTDVAFENAQKQWANLRKLVEKSKIEYHISSQTEQSAAARYQMFNGDTTISADQHKDIADEVAKSAHLKMEAKAVYEGALRDLTRYNPRYVEDMKKVYGKCQDMEKKRLEFFHERLMSIHQILDLPNDIQFKQIFEDFFKEVEAASSENDLIWWNIHRGIDMPMSWPKFEERCTGLPDALPEVHNVQDGPDAVLEVSAVVQDVSAVVQDVPTAAMGVPVVVQGGPTAVLDTSAVDEDVPAVAQDVSAAVLGVPVAVQDVQEASSRSRTRHRGTPHARRGVGRVATVETSSVALNNQVVGMDDPPIGMVNQPNGMVNQPNGMENQTVADAPAAVSLRRSQRPRTTVVSVVDPTSLPTVAPRSTSRRGSKRPRKCDQCQLKDDQISRMTAEHTIMSNELAIVKQQNADMEKVQQRLRTLRRRNPSQ
ncbi:protein kinase C and casein kinase II substrate protein 3-like [Paramacrobiotus metropolitanus]|uniref:protein kinase C and casein kinase II substrate protein 3-like n=1 Tax=Paramacrobiotus metropolitanus TaxID=2943436 RepID=UPI002445C09B|nr:protein kinase C and casein kinase II substrate protein 3-like [Paramacrobiotus metropolitanus]